MALSQTKPVDPNSVGYIPRVPKTIREQELDIIREVANPYAEESGLVIPNRYAKWDWISDSYILYVGIGKPPIDPRTQRFLWDEQSFVKIGVSNRSFKVRFGHSGYCVEQFFEFKFPKGTIRKEVTEVEDEALYAIKKEFSNHKTIVNTMGACREVFELESFVTVMDICKSLQLDEVFPPTTD